jgi:heme/copper-type cytochrome/quinol oxidase subunit 2
MVSFTQTLTREFDVNVVAETPEEETEGISTIWYWIIGIIVVIVIIWFVIKKKK